MPFDPYREPLSIPDQTTALRPCDCPACGYRLAVSFFTTDDQPLTTVCLPEDPATARELPRLPLDFVRCVDCGHIYNSQFEYSRVPYSSQPWLMFNRGATWRQHLKQVRDRLLTLIEPGATVVEVGCAEGQLLRLLAAARPAARYVGFDPGIPQSEQQGEVELRRELFRPEHHLRELRPTVLIARHVLEHLQAPAEFLQQLSFCVSWESLDLRVFAEVPAIEPALESGRTVDFFYEHHSHFTGASLERMLARCGPRIESVERSYNGEVLCALARFMPQVEHCRTAQQAAGFHLQSRLRRERIRGQLDELLQRFPRIAIWGGAGKAVAFMQQYGLDAARFPRVIDSDAAKTGRYVPGSAQQIAAPRSLLQSPVDAVLIATAWRARDIVLEMQATGLPCEQVFLEHDGQLKHFFHDDHPWQFPQQDQPLPEADAA